MRLILETKRLQLRPMCWEDVESLSRVFDDPVMTASAGKPFQRNRMEAWVLRNLEHEERHGYGVFTMVMKTSGLIVGDCGLTHREVSGQAICELGYDVRSDHWGRGLATEAAAAVRDYAFQTVQLPRIVSLIRSDNRASARVAEKIGLRIIDPDVYRDRRYRLYALNRTESPGTEHVSPSGQSHAGPDGVP